MSADNWVVCPRCFDRAMAKDPNVDDADYVSFREDYEFYVNDDGEVVADYSGVCGVCHLNGSFTHKHKFYTPDPEEPCEIPL